MRFAWWQDSESCLCLSDASGAPKMKPAAHGGARRARTKEEAPWNTPFAMSGSGKWLGSCPDPLLKLRRQGHGRVSVKWRRNCMMRHIIFHTEHVSSPGVWSLACSVRFGKMSCVALLHFRLCRSTPSSVFRRRPSLPKHIDCWSMEARVLGIS